MTKYKKYIFLCLYIWQMNHNCMKCQKSANIKLKYDVDRTNKLYFKCTDCRFKIITSADVKYLDYYLKEVNIMEKLNK